MSHLARRRDGRNTARAAADDIPCPRRRLSGAAARRLLDGSDDGPPPLPQLLAAATAPGTAAELQGEAAARAAFRSSVHATPVPLRSPRTARAKAATAIVTAKIIAALALTAGTAGGVALATNSYSTHLQQDPAVSSTDVAVSGVFPSGITSRTTASPTQAPDGTARPDSSGGPGDDGEAAGDGVVPPPRPEAPTPGPTGLCEARCTAETSGAPLTPPGEPGQHTGNPPAGNGNGNNLDKKKANNGNNSAKEKNANKSEKGKSTANGSNADQEKGTNNGNQSANGSKSDAAKNGNKNADKDVKASGDGQSSPNRKQAGVEKGPGKKKTDAEATTAT